MRRVLLAFQIAALGGVSGLCVVLGLLAMEARRDMRAANSQLQPLTAKVARELDEVHRLTLEAGLTAMEARKASAEERAALPKLTAQAEQSFASLDALLAAGQHTTAGIGASQQNVAQATVRAIASVNQQVQGVAPVLSQAQDALAELQEVERSVDAQVSDPAIASALHHVDVGTAALAASAEDVQHEVHAITHPGWVHRCWGWALDVARVLNPL